MGATHAAAGYSAAVARWSLILLLSCGAPPEELAGCRYPVAPAELIRVEPGAPCRDGARPPGQFVDAAELLGINVVHEMEVVDASGWYEVDVAGGAVADLDGDNALDLLFANAGGRLTAFTTGGRGPLRYVRREYDILDTRGLLVVDLDGDGARDVVATHSDSGVWLRGDGKGGLGSAAPLVPGLDDRLEAQVFLGACAGDLDGDGHVDVYIANHEVEPGFESERRGALPGFGPEFLVKGSCSGPSADLSDRLPKTRVEDKTFLVTLVDLDGDRDLDLYETNDQWSQKALGLDPDDDEKQGNRLFENTGAGFVDVSRVSGADVAVSAMGAAVGDYDNDGLVDLYITAMLPEANALLHNDGGLRFSDRTAALGADTLTAEHDVAWGAVFLDADADGWLDLFVAHGHNLDPVATANPDEQKSVLLLNRGGAAFEPGTAGLDGVRHARSPLVGDLDRDGFPDLVVTNAGSAPHVYLNGCDSRPWLSVRLFGGPGNTDGGGAQVVVRGGGIEQLRPILLGGDGVFGSSAPEASFGLPEGTTVVELEVRWPSGATQVFPGVPVRHLVSVKSPG